MKTLRILSLLASLLFATAGPCSAGIMLMRVDSPKSCPDGLTIKTTEKNGMIQFEVSVDPEKITHAGELYKGRVSSNAYLVIAAAGQQVASVSVSGSTDRGKTSYYFSISPAAAKSSELQLGTWLSEKDGMTTIGGGVSVQIQLAGFAAAGDGAAAPK